MKEPLEGSAKTFAVGDVVLDKIETLQLPAEPQNYEMFYHQTLGDNPQLIQAVRGAATTGLSNPDVAELAERFFPRRRVEDKVQSLGTGVSHEIALVVSAVDQALSDRD